MRISSIKKITLYCSFFLFLGGGLSFAAQATEINQAELHQPWNELLSKNVLLIKQGKASQVDYFGMARNRDKLKAYLATLAAVPTKVFKSWSKDEQLAFLINAYNAWTVEFILTDYKNIESIKDLGSFLSSPWKKEFIPLLGETRSLDNIEQVLIREQFKEPRIHFALNCASIGCPALRAEAYIASNLQQQLESATNLFLSDQSRNRLEDDELQISKIFSWYEEDFELENGQEQSLEQFLIKYSKALNLNEKQQQDLLSGEIDIEYLPYDWSLNRIR